MQRRKTSQHTINEKKTTQQAIHAFLKDLCNFWTVTTEFNAIQCFIFTRGDLNAALPTARTQPWCVSIAVSKLPWANKQSEGSYGKFLQVIRPFGHSSTRTNVSATTVLRITLTSPEGVKTQVTTRSCEQHPDAATSQCYMSLPSCCTESSSFFLKGSCNAFSAFLSSKYCCNAEH